MIDVRKNKTMSTKNAGYALVTSMLLLLVLATMGVSMYGNVNIQEQMAFNMRVKNRTFIAADSLLQNNWAQTGLGEVTNQIREETINDNRYDQNGVLIGAKVSICFYREEPTTIGFATNSDAAAKQRPIKNHSFQAESSASEAATHATTRLALGGFLPLPSDNKTGNCDADGDGVTDAIDKCDDEPAATTDGCPAAP